MMFRPGDRVVQAVYGAGDVIDVNEHHITISFDVGGTRKFAVPIVHLELTSHGSRILRMNDTRDESNTVSLAALTVSRCVGGDIGHREVFVSLDGHEFAILRHGDSVTREVLPGPHRLRIHNTMFWKTIDVELAVGERVEFSTLNRAGWGTYGIATFLGAGPVYLDVARIR